MICTYEDILAVHFRKVHFPVPVFVHRSCCIDAVDICREFWSLFSSGQSSASYLQECGTAGQNSAGCYARFPGPRVQGMSCLISDPPNFSSGIAGCMSRMLTGGVCAETGATESNNDAGKVRSH